MTLPAFGYNQLLMSDQSGRVASVFAYQSPPGQGLRAVMWSGRRKAWIYAPAIVAQYLFDDDFQDRTQEIDRPTAEQISREVLSTELPSETTLTEMCEEGERMGWRVGPPRQ
jgi:hypothetical protein